MPRFLCTACGTQWPDADAPPRRCPVCEDERQFVPPGGQSWTTLERLRIGHSNAWRAIAPDLFAVQTFPAFAIGQRALLVRTPAGNLLWDCVALLDDATEAIVRALGGLAAVAISHPHYYTTMAEWGRAFGVPVWLHADDRGHVVRHDPCLRFWEGETQAVLPEVALHRLGGHFAGATIAHWSRGAGALLVGDVMQVLPDRKHLGLMRSYPCLIPLPPEQVRRMAERCAALPFDAIHGAFADRDIVAGGKEALARSAERHCAWAQAMQAP
ncbi:MBL fold metallo-hydrolase [Craurococcus roseus]|uniref:MBL fold metallo-hydrolase n=1 Tax=Craurococcus roseus TaxID=77585 RepID=A0ABN1FXP5_9PROT